MPDKAEAARRVNACLKRQQLVPSRGEIAYAVRAKFDPANWSDFETAKGLRTSFCSHGVTDWLSILRPELRNRFRPFLLKSLYSKARFPY